MKNNTIQENIKNILELIGEYINREGLKETPARVEKAFQEIFSGYKIDEKICINYLQRRIMKL